jgi:hypothetical protein
MSMLSVSVNACTSLYETYTPSCPLKVKLRIGGLTFSGRSTHICALQGKVEVAKVHMSVQTGI